jgi:hypothetical protein
LTEASLNYIDAFFFEQRAQGCKGCAPRGATAAAADRPARTRRGATQASTRWFFARPKEASGSVRALRRFEVWLHHPGELAFRKKLDDARGELPSFLLLEVMTVPFSPSFPPLFPSLSCAAKAQTHARTT